MSNITLTASMRSNLLSLQNTQSLMDMTQERLSTGNKVNSAIDNPSAYYTAQSLNNRASDLGSLLDSMGQAVQTIKAADEAIESISAFAEQAKAVANSARDASDSSEVKNYQEQFNEIRKQITSLAADAGYKGVNLLGGNDLKVVFNEKGSSSITIKGVEASADKLGVNEATAWTGAETKITTNATDYDPAGTSAISSGAYVISDGKLYKAKAEVAVGGDGKLGAFDATKFDFVTDNAKLVAASKTAATTNVTVPGPVDKTAVETSITEIEGAIASLRSMASTFGNNYSIVQSREEFTENLINVLTEGADKLTLADMNEESANMLALQTRQQLAINSLSLASQASQSVLKLF